MIKAALTGPLANTTLLSPYRVTNVAACPSCNGFVRRSRPAWWQWLLADNRGRFHCRHCGTHFYRHG